MQCNADVRGGLVSYMVVRKFGDGSHFKVIIFLFFRKGKEARESACS